MNRPIQTSPTTTPIPIVADETFRCMGTEIRLMIGNPIDTGESAAAAAIAARTLLEDFDNRLSRFKPDSELCQLNADQRTTVPISTVLGDLIAVSLQASEQTDGLVDPTLIDAVELAGYRESRNGAVPARLQDALLMAPQRHAAQPNPDRRWREIRLDRQESTVTRPAGLRLDSGGSGKGLAADLVADRLAGFARVVVDCGGDIRVGALPQSAEPYEIAVEHPLTREQGHLLRIWDGAVATSSIGNRIWLMPDNSYGHHLIDPATGSPAWTGLIAATAVAENAHRAETLSKAALLSGPEAARSLLNDQGGILFHDDGEAELVGPLAANQRRRYTLRRNLLAA